MKKLLNTLYVTSENSYLGLDGENIVVFEEQKEIGRLPLHNLEGIVSFGYQRDKPSAYGRLCRPKYFLVLPYTTGEILSSGDWKSKRKCYFTKTAV